MADENRLTGVSAIVFDAYGTLFDVHSPTARVAGRIGAAAEALSKLWREKQLEYTWLRSLMDAHVDFAHVTGDALDYAFAAQGIEDDKLAGELLRLYLTLDAYPETHDTLSALKSEGMPMAILSNGSPDMLASAVASAGLGDCLDHVLSAEEVGIFKPNARVYQLAVDRIGVAKDTICFVSANGWDIAGAAHFGFQAVWLNRFGMAPERLPGRPRAVITALRDLMPLLS